jgi:hypothetical protein
MGNTASTAFGENLITAGPLEKDVYAGDELRIGEARIGVTQPTERCRTIGRRLGLPRILKVLHQFEACGFYARVIDPGKVSAMDIVQLHARPQSIWSIKRLHQVMFRDLRNDCIVGEVMQIPELCEDWKRRLEITRGRARRGEPLSSSLAEILRSSRASVIASHDRLRHPRGVSASGANTMLSYVPGRIVLQVALVAFAVGFTANPSVAAKITACTQLAICYCVNDDLKDVIEAKVARFRDVLATERKAGKAIGYMSVPLSTVGGGFFNVNMEVAAAAKRHIEKRFGDGQVWILNPGVPEANIPNGSGADYMLMWTQLLEGKEGLGEDFDFVYFVGPRDFARYLALDGNADMLRIEQFFDKRLESDPDLKKAVEKGLTRSAFRNYYALKASATFSKGAHDEWNIVRALNERRRAHDRFGIANQLAVLFDGAGVAPSSSEGATSDGYTGKCVN